MRHKLLKLNEHLFTKSFKTYEKKKDTPIIYVGSECKIPLSQNDKTSFNDLISQHSTVNLDLHEAEAKNSKCRPASGLSSAEHYRDVSALRSESKHVKTRENMRRGRRGPSKQLQRHLLLLTPSLHARGQRPRAATCSGPKCVWCEEWSAARDKHSSEVYSVPETAEDPGLSLTNTVRAWTPLNTDTSHGSRHASSAQHRKVLWGMLGDGSTEITNAFKPFKYWPQTNKLSSPETN